MTIINKPVDALIETDDLNKYSVEEIKDISEKVEKEIYTHKYHLKFEPILEGMFDESTRKSTRTYLLVGGFVLLIIYNLFFFIDRIILSDIVTTAIIVRLGVVTPLIILFLITLSRRIAPWVRDGLKTLISVILGVSIIFLAGLSKSQEAIFYFSGLILIITFGNIFIRMRFWYALTFSLIILFVYIVYFPMDFHLPWQVRFTDIIFLTASILMTLFTNFNLDKSNRMRFLLGLRELLQRRVLADQNLQLSELSSTDPLTGLANRREVDNYLVNLNQIRPEILSIIMIDIDFFKQFNDLYGHPAGDKCLQQIAEILTNSVHRKRDLVGRYGGEEFVIILPETNLGDTEKIAQRILRNVRTAAIPHNGSSVNSFVTLSVGAASGEVAATGVVASILKAADVKLYEAKESGRDQVKSIDLEGRTGQVEKVSI
jgi:diguanylate cyclase (GGDEF)-like protein